MILYEVMNLLTRVNLPGSSQYSVKSNRNQNQITRTQTAGTNFGFLSENRNGNRNRRRNHKPEPDFTETIKLNSWNHEQDPEHEFNLLVPEI